MSAASTRPLDDYRAALRERFGTGNFRIERRTIIRAKLGGNWIVFGYVGDPESERQLFGPASGPAPGRRP